MIYGLHQNLSTKTGMKSKETGVKQQVVPKKLNCSADPEWMTTS